ncbi:hypothetical protein PsorP6_015698 [Peronosclerospora sorghi]|uniref:Uncharacterized protein n=1 Tax=Peronosclerospora sorghi TaxID=230839 RepID=A0ACC0WQF7_9STRA|nr:hypothetical protein PsorP6_015698 [Peronosclerospora sorghi]
MLDFQGNIEDFHDLFLHLQSAYPEVDAVFAASGLATMDIPISDNLDQPYTIIEDFTKEMYSNNSRADIKSKQIVQRIKLPDRDMILFVSSVNPVEIKHKPLDGLVYHAR